MYMGDVKSKTFLDTNASSATYVAAAAQPTSTFTLANTSFGTNTARKKLLVEELKGTGEVSYTMISYMYVYAMCIHIVVSSIMIYSKSAGLRPPRNAP